MWQNSWKSSPASTWYIHCVTHLLDTLKIKSLIIIIIIAEGFQENDSVHDDDLPDLDPFFFFVF